MTKPKRKPVAPIAVRSWKAWRELPFKGVQHDGCVMLPNADEVQIEERDGSYVTIPRATFDAFVRWYTTGVWRKPRGRRG